ncbi:PREDICTED: protocadherin gamma-A4-like, partial [Tinamus guttatus]
ERIDREQLCGQVQMCLINLEILVEFSMKVFKVDVEITDLNDNAPKFQQDKLQFRISETAAVGTRFPLEEAQDMDVGLNALQRYELSGDEHFALDAQTGADGSKYAELVLSKALDREEVAFHDLVLTAVDGGDPARTGMARIHVVVLDANDNPPVFSQAVYTVRVREDVPVGSVLLAVNATDADEGTNADVAYSLRRAPGGASRLFQVDPRSGDVTTVGRLDYEESPLYELEVQAKDGGDLLARAKVLVNLIDVNDNAPLITVTSVVSSVSENSPRGTVIALLKVKDEDSGASGKVRLSLADTFPFRLEKSFEDYYSVVTSGELDREAVAEYNVTVRATDGGSPALWSSAVLPLRVLDGNDNAPVFAEARYSAWLPENNAKGALVLTVRAWDADWGENARVRYRLWEGQVRGAPLSSYVSVHAETGALYALRSFDYEEVREVELWVRAEDGGAPALSSNVSVRLLIVDENDNAPQVLYPPAASLLRAGCTSSAGPPGAAAARCEAAPQTEPDLKPEQAQPPAGRLLSRKAPGGQRRHGPKKQLRRQEEAAIQA